jgi:hypothetical protein
MVANGIDERRTQALLPLFMAERQRRLATPEKESDMAGGLGSCIDTAAFQQGLDLGGQPEGGGIIGVVERFDAKGVAGQQEPLLAPISEGKGVHAVQVFKHRLALLGIEIEQHLGIGVGAEHVALVLELRAQGAVVVDLPR